jgi:3-keto-5-aminohexanoate cleavage enzyme
MRLAEQGKIIIKVGCNEFALKEDNPNVPYSPEEVAADAAECAAAGAAVVHFHSRFDDGRQATEDDSNGANIYRRGIELTGKVSDVIIYPTGHYRGGDPLTSADLPPVFALINDPPPGAPLELAPVDGYRFERDNLYPFSYPGLDPVTGNLLPTPSGAMGDQYVTDRQVPRYETTEVIREIVEAGVVPVFSPFDLTQFRLVYHLAREGQVPQPAFTQIMLYGDRIWGPSARPSAFDTYLSEWSEDVEAEHFYMPVCMSDAATHRQLIEAALDRGLNIRVGLGDNPKLSRGQKNADLVHEVVEAAARRGLTPATPAEVRTRFNLKPRP